MINAISLVVALIVAYYLIPSSVTCSFLPYKDAFRVLAISLRDAKTLHMRLFKRNNCVSICKRLVMGDIG